MVLFIEITGVVNGIFDLNVNLALLLYYPPFFIEHQVVNLICFVISNKRGVGYLVVI